LRETREELGLDAEIIRFAGVIKICFKCKDESFMFHSYLFILRETGGRLLIDAADDEVSGVKEADIKELEEIVESLGGITGEWSDWGKFRHLTSRAVLGYLKEHALIG
jgi:8-oxo-dGTP diphosphatase